MAAKRKKGGQKLEDLRRQKKHRETGGGAPRSKVPKLLKRPPPPPSIGPKNKNGSKAKDFGKRAGGIIYDFAETMANPAAPLWNKLVGDSKWNTKNLTRKVLPGPLKKIVPQTKPPSKKPGSTRATAPKTWRDRMNGRRNLG